MPPYLAPLRLVQPSLPERCEPANDFLYHLSATFHTCVPTNLALFSTVLGTCSIISWLFAQLPQIFKNHKLKSTSGLSVIFLTEWLLGDLTNLLGCIFTGQATWQIIIAGYYVFVDCALCGQWIWYELLHHGRPLRPIWGSEQNGGNGNNGSSGMHEVWDGSTMAPSANNSTSRNPPRSPPSDQRDSRPSTPGRNIPNRSNPMDAFRIPNFARSPSSYKDMWQGSPTAGTPPNRNVRRVAASSSPMPSPKTVLYITLVLAVLSNTSTAKSVSPFAPASYNSHRSLATQTASAHESGSASELAGKVLSWMSTLLYLGSRLPQLYKNYVRKSTAGLSPTLFAAAFFGNLFYSSSLLTNPCAWNDYAPGEGAGWVGPEGSVRFDWVLRATPFFLGAAGVLLMDAAVGFQFWYFGDNEPRGRPKARDEEIILEINDHGLRMRRRFRWRRVSGWMRGWVPAVSVAATPSTSRTPTPVQTPRESSPKPSVGSGSDVESSRSIPIRGALDEARALLGTERHASPRSYGGI